MNIFLLQISVQRRRKQSRHVHECNVYLFHMILSRLLKLIELSGGAIPQHGNLSSDFSRKIDKHAERRVLQSEVEHFVLLANGIPQKLPLL